MRVLARETPIIIGTSSTVPLIPTKVVQVEEQVSYSVTSFDILVSMFMHVTYGFVHVTVWNMEQDQAIRRSRNGTRRRRR